MAPISKIKMLRLQEKYGNDVNIGKKLGITKSRVFFIRSKYGIPSTKPDNTERNKKILAMREKGASFTVLSEKYGLVRSNVFYICQKQQKK